jgi:trans-aconitate 2-methyltransferase
MWNPGTYLQFGSERARPFLDLLTRVQAEDPEYVVDLGCGPGNLTALLSVRWPAAQVLGVDSSPEMIEAARAEAARAEAARAEAARAEEPRAEEPRAKEPSAEAGQAEAARAEAARAEAARAEAGQAAGQAGPVWADEGSGCPAAPGGRLTFALADIRTWQPARPADVFTCNAALQWIPGHLTLLTSWAGWLAPGGWLAFQVPGNFDQPSHTILRELAASARWRPLLSGVQLNRQAADPATYLDLLSAPGCEVDAWETTYLHVLRGEDAVVQWYKGSGLRPVLAALTEEQAAEFTAEYGAQIRQAYPAAPYGTVLPFRRIFVVARR